MEIGTEISHKIRSAIKAKLVELGAYVDEELPDYIMVMVANKKAKTQMSDDLNLFLGGNTDKFTAWLHTLINKLQSISTEAVEEEKETLQPIVQIKEEPIDRDLEAEVYKNNEETHEKKAEIETKRHSSHGDREVNVPETQTTAKTPNVNIDNVTPVSQVIPVSKVTLSSIKANQVIKAPEEVEFIVRAETDEFSEELYEHLQKPKKSTSLTSKISSSIITEPRILPTSSSVPVTALRSSQVTASRPSQVTASRSTGSIISRLGERKTSMRSDDIIESRAVTVGRRISLPPIQQASMETSSRASLKRRAPSSVVKSFARSEELEEEYDPHNPLVGSVASVVKVTARKSRALQANTSLLMKAMSAAEKSVTVVRPDIKKDRMNASAIYSIGRGVATFDSGGGVNQYDPQVPGLTSRSKKAEIIRKMKYTIDNEPYYDLTEDTVDVPVPVPDSRVVRVNPEEDDNDEDVEVNDAVEDVVDRTTIIVTDERIAERRNEEEDEQPGNEEVIPVILEEDASDDFLEQEETEVKMVSNLQGEDEEITARMVKDNSNINTRFIVTLDGVDPEKYEVMDLGVEERDHMETMVPPDLPPQISTPKVKQFSINLMDSDDEDEAEMTPLKRAKMHERCRFWPACVNGNTCEYHHPTVPCKTFPGCKFGDKCLYIHPNCKYDSHCSKSDCPFTHSSKRKSMVISPPQVIIPQPQVILAAPSSMPLSASHPRQITCRFYPSCHNMKCPFKHPKHCRYGLGCAKKTTTCPFFHPVLPTKDKLTWKSNQLGQDSQSSSSRIKA